MTHVQHRALVVDARARAAYYAQINAQILAVAARVPVGRITTFEAIGRLLDVPRHHVAYLLARSTDPERCAVPWYRVVGRGGAVPAASDQRRREQRDLLRREGVRIGANGMLSHFAQLFVPPILGLDEHGLS